MSRHTLSLPYGRTRLSLTLDHEQLKAVLTPGKEKGGLADETALVRNALANPIGSATLGEMARQVSRVLILTSDHTRPVPSRLTLPLLLEEIRRYNPRVQVKILVATGFHRCTSLAEQLEKFGETLVQQEEIVVHDCHDRNHLVAKGTLPSGGALLLNDLVDWADLLVAEGFIEPHFFAGFSGGRKSVLPGIAGAATVLANHCAEFIANPFARAGVLASNPLHRDMLYAAEAAGLAFILNVALDADKKITQAFAGHPDQAHLAGCAWVGAQATVTRREADLVITSNGGYPLDQIIYQAVKGMTAGEACVRQGGVVIMVAACEDGHGGEAFYRWLAEAPDPSAVTARIMAIPRQDTQPDQWEAQILARILVHCTVILVTDRCTPSLVRAMHLQHASTLDEAMTLARGIVGDHPDIVVIPDGVSVIVQMDDLKI
ncbi:MAG: nickel-dependent lactate racemase [Ruminococcaceae bacterium]|nr:nickel-dependent lactate racemase [Oscillospiraceae bacterium]